jgi:DNA polymerase III subunit epsilon
LFAIVDIETTGGIGNNNKITEVAIIIHNGKNEVGRYETLVNPQKPIDRFVQSMTGITNEMVATAPVFTDVAFQIFNLLENTIFVAHNVNFDYSFLKHELQQAGFEIDLPKICTVKLSRKIFPGLVKYGLGGLAKHFKFSNNARHRAMGDAQTLCKLFMLLIANDREGEIESMSKKRKQSQYLPPNLTDETIASMPSLPGVYFFHDNKQKVIYVGKAINLKKRVASHFSNNKISKQKQDFLREVYSITWQDYSSNLLSCIHESIAIKNYWPKFNKSQKNYEKQYGIFLFEDNSGYLRLAIENRKKIIRPLATFSMLVLARQSLQELSDMFSIDPYYFYLNKLLPSKQISIKKHNQKIDLAMEYLSNQNKNYLVHDKTGHYILVVAGKFFGIGKITLNIEKLTLESIKKQVTPYLDNSVIYGIISKYAMQNESDVIWL